MKRLAAVGLMCVLMCSAKASAYTWYVYEGASGANDGSSWADAYTVITNALNALAATNEVEGFNGGHEILVTNPAGNAINTTMRIHEGHSGADGTPNVIRDMGASPVSLRYEADGNYWIASVGPTNAANFVENITIDGFRWERGYASIQFTRCTNIVVRNGVYLYPGLANPHMDVNTDASVAFTNNVFLFCSSDSGTYSGAAFEIGGAGDVFIKNCVFLGTQADAVNVQSVDRLEIRNCAFYANNGPALRVSDGATFQELATADMTTDRYYDYGSGNYFLLTNCIASSPGFADSAGNLYFDTLYDISPLIGAGEGGQNIGVSQNPTLVTVPASPTTYYVDDDGSDADGLSWDTAWNTIAQATAVAVAGDTVLVGAGTYAENVDIVNGGMDGRPVTYRAVGDVTITAYDAVEMYGVGQVTLDGFKLVSTGGAGVEMDYVFHNTFMNMDVSGGGFGFDLNTAMCSNMFYNCEVYDTGYGVHLFGEQYSVGGSVLRDCRIYNCTTDGVKDHTQDITYDRCIVYANGGDGLHLGNGDDYERVVYNSLVYSNARYGVYSSNTRLEMANTTLYGNLEGLHIRTDADRNVVNTILAGNLEYGAFEEDTTDISAKNCLFWNNGSDLGTTTNHFRETDGSTWTNVFGTASDIDNLTEGAVSSGTVVGDPAFVSVLESNFRIGNSSAALDAGDAALVDATFFPDQTVDLDGKTRVKMTALDIGAYEWQPPQGTLFMIR